MNNYQVTAGQMKEDAMSRYARDSDSGRTTDTDDTAAGRRLNYFDYFTEIEDYFVKRRGKTLLLSPMDWALIEGWKLKGVPLHVALRGIERSFESYEKRPTTQRRRSVKTLFYCAEEVEAQYAEWLESQVGSVPASVKKNTGDVSADVSLTGNGRAAGETATTPFAPDEVSAYMMRTRESLTELCTRHKDDSHARGFCESVERVITRLDELAGDWQRAAQPSAERLEASLTNLELLLDEALPSLFTSAQFEAERRASIAQLEPYRRRMEPSTYDTTLAHLLRKRLRDKAGVPRLSLFHL